MKMRAMAKMILLLFGVAVTFFLSTNSAYAIASIKLDDGINTPLIISDGGVGDSSAATGVITYSGTYGVF